MVNLNYRSGPNLQPIAATCESIKNLLLPFASALNGAKLVFDARIDRNDFSDFSDQSMIFAHVGNDLLSVCNRCRAYEFHVSFLSEQNAPIVISSILEMEPVRDCGKVKFVLLGISRSTALPVEAITKWFVRNIDDRRKYKKSLKIRMPNISNGAEIEARLKEAKYGCILLRN